MIRKTTSQRRARQCALVQANRPNQNFTHWPTLNCPTNQNITKWPTVSITNCYLSFGNSLSEISHLETDITKQGNEERKSVEAKDLEELVMDSEEENLDMVGAYGEEVNFLPK